MGGKLGRMEFFMQNDLRKRLCSHYIIKAPLSLIRKSKSVMNEFIFPYRPSEFKQEFQSLPLIATASKITDGGILPLGENCIKKNKTLTLCTNINSLGKIILRHGKNKYGTAYVTIDTKKLEIYDYTTEAFLKYSENHGLNLYGKIKIILNSNNADAITVSISNENSSFTSPSIWWAGGCRGIIELEVVRGDLSDVEMIWNCEDFGKSIWFFGDSYLGISNPNRWPSHIIGKGCDTALFSGFPGARAQDIYPDFVGSLKFGKPKFAVWCLGMNNSDSSIFGINKTWKVCTEAFICECVNNGITPILTTIPNTPIINNNFKNNYVKNSGYRYIDFASAVGATEAKSKWYEGMLTPKPDNVHPTEMGAKALAEQVLKDFPEIKG